MPFPQRTLSWTILGLCAGLVILSTVVLRPSFSSLPAAVSTSAFLPIVGDWNGDCIVTGGLYDPATSTFYLRDSNTSGGSDYIFGFGAPGAGWLPVAGDWNMDGTDTIGLYDPISATFYLRNSNTAGTADVSFVFGDTNAKPFVGHWKWGTNQLPQVCSNGKRRWRNTDVGTWSQTGKNFKIRNADYLGNSYTAHLDITGHDGLSQLPAIGDWDSDGIDGIGLYDFSQFKHNFFTEDNLSSVGFNPASGRWVIAPEQYVNGVPLVGDWNGDGQETVGNWYNGEFELTNSNLADGSGVSPVYDARYSIDPVPVAASSVSTSVSAGSSSLSSVTGYIPIAGDWDGDCTMTAGLYDPATATFYLRNSLTTGWPDLTVTLTGSSGGPLPSNLLPIAGDFNSDGIETVGVYNPETSNFSWRDSNTSGVVQFGINFGDPGSFPVTGNWRGTGTATRCGLPRNMHGTYNPAMKQLKVRTSLPTSQKEDTLTQLGTGNNIRPLAGDWNGDGIYGLSLVDYASGIFTMVDNAVFLSTATTDSFLKPLSTWIPLMGDWDANKISTVGWFSPSTNTFSLSTTPNGGAAAQISFAILAPGITRSSIECTSEFTTTPPATTPLWQSLMGDWNGDGVDTIGTYDSATSTFYLRNGNSTGGADVTFGFGAPGAEWEPFGGDWDGDAKDTIGLYDPATSTFYLRNNNSTGGADAAFGFGAPKAGWEPISGDWDGDGKDTIGLYDPKTSTFYLRNNNSTGGADATLPFGADDSGWRPLAGDWNNDGKATIGVYDPWTSSFHLRNTNTPGAVDIAFGFGPTDSLYIPIAGDWDKLNGESIGLYSPISGSFLLRNTNSIGFADAQFGFGQAESLTAPMIYDTFVPCPATSQNLQADVSGMKLAAASSKFSVPAKFSLTLVWASCSSCPSSSSSRSSTGSNRSSTGSNGSNRSSTGSSGSTSSCTPDCSRNPYYCTTSNYEDGCGGWCYGTADCGDTSSVATSDPSSEPSSEGGETIPAFAAPRSAASVASSFSFKSCGPCDDGNKCNGTETCNGATGLCVAGTPVTCTNVAAPVCYRADGNCYECNTDTDCLNNPNHSSHGDKRCWRGSTGWAMGVCRPCTSNGDCDDGDKCNGTETCTLTTGFCAGGIPVKCAGAAPTCYAPDGNCYECSTDTDCLNNQINHPRETLCWRASPSWAMGVCKSRCGNGTIDAGEACDDGNAAAGDGCSISCAIETGWSCTGSPESVCTRIVSSSSLKSSSSKASTGVSPVGYNEGTNCSVISGWACDTDAPTTPLNVQLAYDNGVGTPQKLLVTLKASLPREAAVAVQCGNNAKHGFNYFLPPKLKDGKMHTLYVTAVNIGGGKNTVLNLISFTCGGSSSSAKKTSFLDPLLHFPSLSFPSLQASLLVETAEAAAVCCMNCDPPHGSQPKGLFQAQMPPVRYNRSYPMFYWSADSILKTLCTVNPPYSDSNGRAYGTYNDQTRVFSPSLEFVFFAQDKCGICSTLSSGYAANCKSAGETLINNSYYVTGPTSNLSCTAEQYVNIAPTISFWILTDEQLQMIATKYGSAFASKVQQFLNDIAGHEQYHHTIAMRQLNDWNNAINNLGLFNGTISGPDCKSDLSAYLSSLINQIMNYYRGDLIDKHKDFDGTYWANNPDKEKIEREICDRWKK